MFLLPHMGLKMFVFNPHGASDTCTFQQKERASGHRSLSLDLYSHWTLNLMDMISILPVLMERVLVYSPFLCNTVCAVFVIFPVTNICPFKYFFANVCSPFSFALCVVTVNVRLEWYGDVLLASAIG